VFNQENIFHNDQAGFKPLAHRLRPSKIEDLVGNLKTNQAFIGWYKYGIKQSAIFWGPPGTGKTSIAELCARQSKKNYIKLQAFNSGVKELRDIILQAEKIPNSILLFVDEVHNFNKSQQDILLNAIEHGFLTFIGATTENPAVSINRALLSRTLRFELKPHSLEDLEILILKALKHENRSMSQDAISYLAKTAWGDARNLLSSLELIINSTDHNPISLDACQDLIGRKVFAGDPNSYYDCVSALQKSIRGSSVEASLYWLARLLEGGAELEAIARRILVTASEDVGLADPQALILANSAYQAALRLGMPEARIVLAQAVSYIAQAPKSNTSYKALEKALQICRNHPPYPVPEHLRGIHLDSCPAKSDSSQVNPKTQYKYPHDYPGNWVEQEYLPSELQKPSSLK
jgi:putative ATPase